MLHKGPLVSILLFTYNGEKFLREQLDSLIHQTYKNIEILAFDDASTDSTVDILKEYHQKHGLIFRKNSSNIGLSKSFINALNFYKGDYIATCDQDDIWEETKIEQFVKNIRDNILIYSDSIPMNENGDVDLQYQASKNYNFIQGSCTEAFLLFNCISGHNMMFKKELVPYIEALPKTQIYYDWWVAYIASNYGQIAYYPKPLTYYRRHASQQTHSRTEKHLNFIIRLIKKDKSKNTYLDNMITILQSFYQLRITKPQNKNLIKNLIIYFIQRRHTYYNKNLYHFLSSNKKALLTMIPEEDQKKMIHNLAKGLWYFRLRWYL